MTLWGGLLLAVSTYFNIYLLLRRPKCRHHWHPADAMIAWRCCWCDAERDGWPLNNTDYCAEKTISLERERDRLMVQASHLLGDNTILLKRNAELAGLIQPAYYTDYRELLDAPEGVVVADSAGKVWAVVRPSHETYVCPFSDEYAFLVKPDGSTYALGDTPALPLAAIGRTL